MVATERIFNRMIGRKIKSLVLLSEIRVVVSLEVWYGFMVLYDVVHLLFVVSGADADHTKGREGSC